MQQTDRSLSLAMQELEVSRPLQKIGALSKLEIINLEAKVNTLDGEKSALSFKLTRAESALVEADARLQEIRASQRNEF